MGDLPLNHFDVMCGAALVLVMRWLILSNLPFGFVIARISVSRWKSETICPSVS